MKHDSQVKRRYRIRWKRLMVIVFLFVLCSGSALAAAIYHYLNNFHQQPQQTAYSAKFELKPAVLSGSRINILALGVDDGEYGVGEDQPRRSDTMMLISIDPANNRANILSIPRDTAVNIPTYKGLDKIAHAHAYGGPDLAVRTVSQMLDVPVHYYIEADFQGFEGMVDILGGVDLYVEKNMSYEDPYANLTINLRQGFQHLDGSQAGQYVRFRHDELGDIGRVQRQQKFMEAVADKLLQPNTLLKIPSLANSIKQNLRTDMSAVQLFRLANSVKGLKRDNMIIEMLPGNFGEIDEISYWIMDTEETKLLVEKMFNDPVSDLADARKQ